jgi:lysophospholipase L1-like esterase
VFAVAALVADDGDIDALADRVTPAGQSDTTARPQVFGSGPVRVADEDDDIDNDIDNDATPDPDDDAVPGGQAMARTAIEDACLAGPTDRCTKWGMDGFYRAVVAARAGKLGRPLRVSYYGDSVISTDAVPARVRARLQKEFGDGGPGFIWAARPHRFCWHEGVTVTNGGTWKTSMVSTKPAADGLHGLGNAMAETTSGSVTLASKRPVSIVDVYYLAQPGGGTADVIVGGEKAATIATSGDAKRAGFQQVTAAAPAKSIKLATSGKVRLFGVVLENPTGAVVDNMGIVSATPKNMAHNRADHFSAQLAHRDADLVVIMLGANEAQWLPPTATAMTEYQTQYETILAPIRAGIGDASCLVMSPLDQAYDTGSGLASRPVMPKLVAAQRAAASKVGCSFYSAYDWAGGKGSSLKWRQKKLVGDDFQHLSRRGANRLADGLVDTLLAGAKDFAAR